jgi:hypothetical protein
MLSVLLEIVSLRRHVAPPLMRLDERSEIFRPTVETSAIDSLKAVRVPD